MSRVRENFTLMFKRSKKTKIKTKTKTKATAREILFSRQQLFIKTASKYIGFTAGPQSINAFGQRVGYDSQPWSGAFIDVVARECGLEIPACVYSANGLAEFINSGQVVKRPAPGDIVFFNFSSEVNSSFAMPHVGIVVDVRDWDETGRFLTIEGNINSGTRYNEQRDGVFKKLRYSTDVILFARPKQLMINKFINNQLLTKLIVSAKLLNGLIQGSKHSDAKIEEAQLLEAAADNKALRISSLQPGLRNRSIEVLQLSLSVAVGLKGAQRGVWDQITQHAYAKWQRSLGYVGPTASGLPDDASLRRLAAKTKLFTVVG